MTLRTSIGGIWKTVVAWMGVEDTADGGLVAIFYMFDSLRKNTRLASVPHPTIMLKASATRAKMSQVFVSKPCSPT
jgi:hypothetical protein